MENNTTPPKHDSTARAVFAAIFGVIAVLLLIPTTVAVWFNFQVLNPQKASTTLTKVIVLPGVRDIIAESLASSIVEGATTSDLAQAILSADQRALDEQTQRGEIQKVVKSEINKIIATPSFTNLIQTEVQKALNTIVDIANGKNTTGVINFNPLVVGVINSTSGTRIAIIGEKITPDATTGVITLTQQNLKDIKNYLDTAKTTMIVEIAVFVVCLLLSIIIANHRLRVLRRLALVAGIIYTVYGLVLVLVPQLLIAVVKDAQAVGAFEAVRYIINPLAYFSLTAGIILVFAVIIANIASKIAHKQKPQEPHKKPADSSKESKVKAKPEKKADGQ